MRVFIEVYKSCRKVTRSWQQGAVTQNDADLPTFSGRSFRTLTEAFTFHQGRCAIHRGCEDGEQHSRFFVSWRFDLEDGMGHGEEQLQGLRIRPAIGKRKNLRIPTERFPKAQRLGVVGEGEPSMTAAWLASAPGRSAAFVPVTCGHLRASPTTSVSSSDH